MKYPPALQNDVDRARKISARLPRSPKWKPMDRMGDFPDGAETYMNDRYFVTCRRYDHDWFLDPNLPYAVLGISLNDGSALHDWRDFQKIKNQLVGDEWEAIELYPAESRLIDPSNYYLLWCAPKIQIGKFLPRAIADHTNCIAPQRGWRSGDEPPELKK